MLCPIKIYVSKHKLNYTIGWSKSGKETYCKGCFKPTTQRTTRQNMPKTWAERKRNPTHSLSTIRGKIKFNY